MANIDLALSVSFPEPARASFEAVRDMHFSVEDMATVRCLAQFPDLFVFGCDCSPILRQSATGRLFSFDTVRAADGGIVLLLTPSPRWLELVAALASLVGRGIDIVEGWPVIAAACAAEEGAQP